MVITAEGLVLFYDACVCVHCLHSRFLKPLFACLLLRPEDALMIWNDRTLQFGFRFAELAASVGWIWAIAL